MELSDLRVFRTVVRSGGVTRAARELHRVQSNVTMRVKKLEEELGVALFVREGRTMQLTGPGKVVLDYADRLLALADEVRSAVRESRPSGVLRLGAMESTAAVRVPAALTSVQARHPDLHVELHSGNPQQLTSMVVSGDLDAALVAEPVSDERLETLPAYLEELVIVGPAGHAPIRSPRDVKKRTLLAFHPGCPYRRRLEDWFERGKVMPERIVELASYHAMLGCAVAGMGVALLPKGVLDAYAERARLSVHPLSGRFHSARTLLIWRKDAPQANIAAFAEIVSGAEKTRR